MTPEQRLGRYVKAKNKELEGHAKEELIVGATFTGFVFGGLAIVGFLIGLISYDSKLFGFLFALGIVALAMSLALFACWKTVNPQREIIPMDDPREVTKMLAGATPLGLYFTPEHELPGIASFLFGGPEGLVKYYGVKQHLLSADDALLERSMKLLRICGENGYPLKRMKNPQAAVLLRQLSLVRVEKRDSGLTLVVTEDGRGFLEKVS